MSSRDRKQQAYDIRVKAAKLAFDRPHPKHRTSGDEKRFKHKGKESYIASFTKGLAHDPSTGLVQPWQFEKFVRAVDNPQEHRIAKLPLGPTDGVFVSSIAKRVDQPSAKGAKKKGASVRGWESMGAGLTFDLEGPDAQAVTMPPVPGMLSDELHLEMAEVYWMALLRDVPLSWLSKEGQNVMRNVCKDREHKYRPHLGEIPELIESVMKSINSMKWMTDMDGKDDDEQRRKNLRRHFGLQRLFRGVTNGDNVGPYLSQFLISGNHGLGDAFDPIDGFVHYGAMTMDHRIRIVKPAKDYMTTWAAFLDVQNGADLRNEDIYQPGSKKFRFICTGRDLATYVHHDALYQSYLNACLMMFSMKVPFDEGIPFGDEDKIDKQSGFAQFGGPHILTLLTEVATRALKAVRFQKFNNHRRLRPEAVGGILDRFIGGSDVKVINDIGSALKNGLGDDLVKLVMKENALQNKDKDTDGRRWDLQFEERSNYALLPMAFPEGSPMHPSYGSGHATVGGACVTILKAFFDTDFKLPNTYVVNEDGSDLKKINMKLTVEGELNKLCSNISIGRNWAGVHYFSDYYESIRLGEQIALGILEEQGLLYNENFKMTIPLFNGEKKTIHINGKH